MTNDDFNAITAMIAWHRERMKATDLSALHPGGWVAFARKLRKDIEAWEVEVIARAKADYENMASQCEHVRRDYGEEAFDAIAPNHEKSLFHIFPR